MNLNDSNGTATLAAVPSFLDEVERPARPPFVYRVLRIFLINLGFWAFLGLMGVGDSWSHNFVAAQSIGFAIYFCARLGFRLTSNRSQMPWIQAGAVFVGALLGTGVSLLICGADSFSGPVQKATARTILLGLGFGGAVTYYFYSKGQQARFLTTCQERETRRLAMEKEAIDTRLKLLQAQIEPHFLFNTLANVQVLIDTDPRRARYMLERLIEYLRATLNRTRAEVTTLSGEFELIDSYLAIIAIRMGKRLSYRLDLPAELREYPLPPMLLQPIVENAVKHGLEAKCGGGTLEITARRHDGSIELRVADTGIGFSRSDGSGGFGLTSVRERIRAVYGPAARLNVEENQPSGAVVSIVIPVRSDNETMNLVKYADGSHS